MEYDAHTDELDIVAEQLVERTQKRNKAARFYKNHVYNRDTGRIFDRTPAQLCFCLLFHVAFWIIVVLLWAGCFLTFMFADFSLTIPRYTNEASLMRSYEDSSPNPSLSFRPSPFWYTTLTHFKSGAPATYAIYKNDIEAFLMRYRDDKKPTNAKLKKCGPNDLPDSTIGCYFIPEKSLGDCGKVQGSDFHYDTTGPCFYFKVNRLYGWVPKPYDCRQGTAQECWEKIAANSKFPGGAMALENIFMINYNKTLFNARTEVGRIFDNDSIPITCSGLNPTDLEEIKTIEWQGETIKKWYYPFLNQIGYLSPIAAVRVHIREPGTLMMLRCQSWAENLRNNDHVHRDGTFSFELMID